MLLVNPDSPISVEVQPMNTTLVKVETKDHKGPLQFFIDMHKDGDLTCYASPNQKVNYENKIWTYKYNPKERNKPMTFTPFKAFDENLLTGKQTVNDIDKTLWQPDALFGQFFSEDGCTFSLKVQFLEEEVVR